jgi:MFS family permease
MHADDPSATNHPLAPRMAAIAFIAFNVALGGMYGTFSMLLPAVEARLGVGRELSSLGVPLVSLAVAVMAPVTGILAARVSLRSLLVAGAVLMATGYAMLASAHSILVYLLAFGLLLGPGVAIVGTVMPSTLVTRWFAANRGRALGLVHIPIMLVVMPLAATFVLRAYGLTTVYLLLAALMAVLVVPFLFVVDRPPAGWQHDDRQPSPIAAEPLTVGAILATPQFWTATLGFASLAGGAVLLGAHLFPMATGWGFDPTRAATLIALMSFAGMAGTPLFGWLSDKVGGRNALAIAALDSVFLWLLLLIAHPPFALTAIVIALIGFHGGGIVPSLSMTLSQRFGEASFSRAYGLANMMSLPVTMLVVPIAAAVFVRTGSYGGALAGQAGLLAIAAILLAVIGGGRSRAVAAHTVKL